MKEQPLLSEDERLARRIATRPDENVWVTANAGSGKTSLLRDRVIRLLLDGVPPDRILCLTYTKAAAAEMQTRIFDELARWVGLEDEALAEAITGLTGEAGTGSLVRARALFAEAVEAPGGLKIQTIHAFAERILHLFPIEAGVPVGFQVLEDQNELAATCRRDLLQEAARAPQGLLGQALALLTEATNAKDFEQVLAEAVQKMRRLEGRGTLVPDEVLDVEIETLFGVSPDLSPETLEDRFLADLPSQDQARGIGEAMLAMRPGPQTAQTAQNLIAYGSARLRAERLSAAIEIAVRPSNKKATPPRIEKAVLLQHPEWSKLPEQLQSTTQIFLDDRNALQAARLSRAIHRVARALIARIRAWKQARNVLDFDDLIQILRRMLEDGRSAWVMMKLDAAIEHVLVDEAQDTSAEMWDIIRRLTEDFFAGEGQSRHRRSLFVVGDEKQSIFSFQGAEPRVFDAMRQDFASRIAGPNRIREPVKLRTSFRSSAEILGLVDQVFAEPERRAGLAADIDKPAHHSAWRNMTGFVECWPLESLPPRTEGEDDVPPFPKPYQRVAQRIAAMIADWLSRGERLFTLDRPITPGDILILLKSRSKSFNAILRALAERGIPTAGADRLRIQEQIGVRDLLALASAAWMPADDLTLATALRTPVLAIADAELERLCRDRPGALRARIAADPAHRELHAWLLRQEEAARRLPPHDFLAGLLIGPCPGRPDLTGRMALLKRLGPDAADAIDALLTDALAFAERNPPSLALFIAAQMGQSREIKRDLDSGDGRVRVMTVHGAKGLEAPIVILADSASLRHHSLRPGVLTVQGQRGSFLLWAKDDARRTSPVGAASMAEDIEHFEEYRRLLYVGLTRAKERLFVVGHAGGRRPKEIPADIKPETPADRWHWHALVRESMRNHPHVRPFEQPDAMMPAFHWPPFQTPRPRPPDQPATEKLPAPPLILDRMEPPRPEARLQPSSRRMVGKGASRGILVHRLLQHLPAAPAPDRARFGLTLLEPFTAVDVADREALVRSVVDLIEHSDHRRFFGPDSRAEVPLAGLVRLADGHDKLVSGRIDRLCVTDGRIEILDFKSGSRPAEALMADYIRQMALYRALARSIFGEAVVTTHLLWTDGLRLETLDPARLDAGFAGITSA